jgi:heat shock protein HtpX
MKELNDREMEAVLGHELTHIRNGDVQLMVVAVIIAGGVSFLAELFFRIFLNGGTRIGGGSWRSSRSSSSSGGNSDSKGGGAVVALIVAVALIALAWFLSQVVRLALSRSRELMADAGSVELTKDPDAMISALRKIENRGELPGATSAVMEMCVDNPREGFADLFATHPSIETRVRALVTYAGGRDPGPIRHLQEERNATDPAGKQELPPGPWSEPAPPAPATPPAPGPWGNHS